MATFHRMKDESGRDVVRCFVKGAPDQVLARATQTLAPDDLHLIAADDAIQGALQGRERAPRRAGPARAGDRRARTSTRRSFDPNADLLPLLDGLTLLALVGIVDPPRPTAKAAIADRAFGRDPGAHDHRRPCVTAAAIAAKLGITGRAITGAEFAAMSDDELLAQIDDIGVIARVTPEHKVRLVDTLKTEGARSSR